MAKGLTKADRSRIVQDTQRMRTDARQVITRVREVTKQAAARLDLLRVKTNELK